MAFSINVCVSLYNNVSIWYFHHTYFAYELAFSVMPDVVAVVFLFHLNVVRLHNETSIHVNCAAVVCGLFFEPGV